MPKFAPRIADMEKSALVLRKLFNAMNDPATISFGGGAPAKSTGEVSPVLVESMLDAEEAVVYDIIAGERMTIVLTEKTKVIDEQGRDIAYGGLEMGDLVMVKLDTDGKTALSVDYSDVTIQTKEMTGLKADAAKRRLTGEEDSYAYGEKALFLYDEEKISPKELEPCDLLERLAAEKQFGLSKEELADLLEVVYALAADLGISREMLMEVYDKKHEARGGFAQRIFLEGVEEKRL